MASDAPDVGVKKKKSQFSSRFTPDSETVQVERNVSPEPDRQIVESDTESIQSNFEESDEDPDKEYEVDRILDDRLSTIPGVFYEFQIRWKGYGPNADCWVHVDDMACNGKLTAYWELRPDRFKKYDALNAERYRKVEEKLERKQEEDFIVDDSTEFQRGRRSHSKSRSKSENRKLVKKKKKKRSPSRVPTEHRRLTKKKKKRSPTPPPSEHRKLKKKLEKRPPAPVPADTTEDSAEDSPIKFKRDKELGSRPNPVKEERDKALRLAMKQRRQKQKKQRKLEKALAASSLLELSPTEVKIPDVPQSPIFPSPTRPKLATPAKRRPTILESSPEPDNPPPSKSETYQPVVKKILGCVRGRSSGYRGYLVKFTDRTNATHVSEAYMDAHYVEDVMRYYLALACSGQKTEF